MQINRVVADRRRRQKKRRVYIFSVIALIVLYFIGLGIFAFFVFSPAFHAANISIEGNSTVSNDDIMNLLEASIIRRGDLATAPNDGWKAFLGFHSLFIWPDALPSSTVAFIPQLAGVTISKNYFTHSVTVTVTERQPFAVWCNADDSCFWFDEQGNAFANTLDTQGNAIFIVHDHAPGEVGIGQSVMAPEFLPNLISIIQVMKQANLDVQDISLNDLSLQQIDITLANGPMLYFSLRFPATDDLGVLQQLASGPGFNKLQYVDFTVENRAYYK